MNGDILSSNQGCWILISHQGANVLTLVYTEIPTTSQSGQRWSLVHASYVLFNPLSPGAGCTKHIVSGCRKIRNLVQL